MKRLREAPLLLIGGGVLLFIVSLVMSVAALGLVGPVIPSPKPSTIASSPSDDPSGTTERDAKCAPNDTATYLALTSKHKETKYAFGNPVEARERADVLNGMRAYAYKDPAGAAALTAAFDGAYDHINDRVANYVSDPDLWCQEVDRMMNAATAAKFSTHEVKSGVWSLYMVKTKDNTVPVEIRQGKTSTAGTAAVFKVGDRTIELRLDCHYQPVGESEFPKVPHVPTPTVKTPSPTPSHEATTAPSSTHSATPKPTKTLTPKDTARSDYAHHGDDGKGADVGSGTKPKASATPKPKATAKPVHTSAPSRSSAPPNEGGGTNGGDPGGF